MYGRQCGGGVGGGAVMVPVHLYGQLAATRAGLELVLAQDTFLQMVARLVDASEQIGGTAADSWGTTSRTMSIHILLTRNVNSSHFDLKYF